MKVKSFECPNKSIENYEKKMLGTSDARSTGHLSHRPSEPAYYIVDHSRRLFSCATTLYTHMSRGRHSYSRHAYSLTYDVQECTQLAI